MNALYSASFSGAVHIVGAVAARAGFVVAGLEPGDVEIDRLAVDDGGDRIEEGERIFAGEGADRLGEGGRGEGPGGDHDAVPVVGRQAGDFLAADFDERVGLDLRLDGGGKSVPVDRQRAPPAGTWLTSAEAMMIFQPQRRISAWSRPTALFSSRQTGTSWSRRARRGFRSDAHRCRAPGDLVQNDGHAVRRPPGGLGTGQSAANDMNGLEFGHDRRGT